MMDMDVCRQLIWHLDADGDLEIGHAPDDVQAWLETLGLGMRLLRLMQWHWPQQSGRIEHLWLHSSRDILENDHTQRLLQHKLLNIGSAPNGDLLVIDFSSDAAQPGFVSHEELWPDGEANPRAIFQPIARNLASLLWRVSEGKYVPIDYYAAKAFNNFLVNEHSSSG